MQLRRTSCTCTRRAPSGWRGAAGRRGRGGPRSRLTTRTFPHTAATSASESFAVRGFLPRDALARLYASADVSVFPSHTETCGLVALEAMASGSTVIAADAGGFRESIQRGATGLLVPAHEPRGYSDAIVALADDAATRFAVAAAARDYALSRDVARENAELLDRYAALTHAAQRPKSTTCAA